MVVITAEVGEVLRQADDVGAGLHGGTDQCFATVEIGSHVVGGCELTCGERRSGHVGQNVKIVLGDRDVTAVDVSGTRLAPLGSTCYKARSLKFCVASFGKEGRAASPPFFCPAPK